jgi:hypothetical protein
MSANGHQVLRDSIVATVVALGWAAFVAMPFWLLAHLFGSHTVMVTGIVAGAAWGLIVLVKLAFKGKLRAQGLLIAAGALVVVTIVAVNTAGSFA